MDKVRVYIDRTEEEKLDLILDRCKRNMSSIEGLEKEWEDICFQVSEGNPDIHCPLFRMYIRHLEEVDNFIFADEQYNGPHIFLYRCTANGLMFEGYSNRRERLLKENASIAAYDGRMEKYQKSLRNWTSSLTIATWGAAVAGFGLLVWEARHFLKHLFCSVFHCS